MPLPIPPVSLPPTPPKFTRPPSPSDPPTATDIVEAEKHKRHMFLQIENGHPGATAMVYADAENSLTQLTFGHDLNNYPIPPAAVPGAPCIPVVPGIAGVLEGHQVLMDRMSQLLAQFGALDARTAIMVNKGRAYSSGVPFEEVCFLDGSLPSQTSGDRQALPPLRSIDSIHNLVSTDLNRFLQGYGIEFQRRLSLDKRRLLLAEHIGCLHYKNVSR
ncbi:hypothetical protein D9757_007886 [Collybiopsis confluens]|uniref:Mug135-like C-terminal domain-containing protein n=1 Tax=Collybiopsis confluens TaxID=2823264 RepID=A0A8H5HDG5_9AGAR|nr:hypothetical protein D9757_007886 [Collybiopsis confluens]